MLFFSSKHPFIFRLNHANKHLNTMHAAGSTPRYIRNAHGNMLNCSNHFTLLKWKLHSIIFNYKLLICCNGFYSLGWNSHAKRILFDCSYSLIPQEGNVCHRFHVWHLIENMNDSRYKIRVTPNTNDTWYKFQRRLWYKVEEGVERTKGMTTVVERFDVCLVMS